MRIKQLHSFITVCETGSITSAAHMLNIAQPALGIQIRSLEQEMGVLLLSRGPGGVAPTAEGKILLEEARHIVYRIDGLKRRFNASQTQLRNVSIGLPSSLMKPLAGPILTQMKASHPGTLIRLSEALSHTLVANLKNGDLDVAVAFEDDPGEQLQSEGRFHEDLHFVTARQSPLDVEGPITFVEMSKATLVLPDEKNLLAQLVETAAHQRRIHLNTAYRLDSLLAIKDCIGQGLADGILPWSTIVDEVKAGTLSARPIVEPTLARTLHILRSAGTNPDAALSALFNTLRSIVRDYFSSASAPLERIEGRT